MERLVDATVGAPFDLLLELIEEVEKHSPAWAVRLRELADGFQYDALLDLLQKGT